jgi:hypothetical protein
MLLLSCWNTASLKGNPDSYSEATLCYLASEVAEVRTALKNTTETKLKVYKKERRERLEKLRSERGPDPGYEEHKRWVLRTSDLRYRQTLDVRLVRRIEYALCLVVESIRSRSRLASWSACPPMDTLLKYQPYDPHITTAGSGRWSSYERPSISTRL